MTDRERVRLHLSLKSAEHIEPLNLALSQLRSLHEWMALPNEGLLEPHSVFTAVAGFHPDRKYDSVTRQLTEFGHLSGLWLLYEKAEFSPKAFEYWTRLALARGHEGWANMGPVDHRKVALTVSAQMAVFEGEKLRRWLSEKSGDIESLWRHLYWFNRFYRAWQRIGAGFTPSQFANLQKKAVRARAWKKAAWDYFLTKTSDRPSMSARTIAFNFAKQHPLAVSAHEVQVYLGQRQAIAGARKTRGNKTVG